MVKQTFHDHVSQHIDNEISDSLLLAIGCLSESTGPIYQCEQQPLHAREAVNRSPIVSENSSGGTAFGWKDYGNASRVGQYRDSGAAERPQGVDHEGQ